MNRRTLLKVLIVTFILVSLIETPVYAWKGKTHVYSANLILEDAIDGYVEIKPYGKFAILPEYADLLRLYPEYYRAGALGPDLMPDILIGQTIFHPGNTFNTSGDMINTFWHLANELPDYVPSEQQQIIMNSISSFVQIDVTPPKDESDPANDFLRMNNKKQAKAFMLGFMAHAAGDYFGHSYINKWAGSSWPDVTNGMSTEEKNIIKRHSAVEAYIDSQIPTKYKAKQYNIIKSPQRFIFDTMLVDGELNMDNIALDSRMAQFFGEPECVPPHLKIFFSIRDACRNRIITINNNRNGNAWDKFVWGISLQPAQKAYCEAWIEDIDRGLGAWIDANERAAQTTLIDGNGMDKYKEELKKWYNEHLMSMLGYPDVAVSIKNGLGSVSDFIMEIVPDSVEEDYKKAKQDAINYAIKKAFSINLEEWMTLLNPPTSVIQTGGLFPADAFNTINAEMGNFNLCTNTNDQNFAPFKNTLTLMKLILIGEPGIKELRRVSGSQGSLTFPPFRNTMTYFIRNMDYGYDWKKDEPFLGFFMYGSNEDKNKILNVIFDLNPDEVKPSFSNMTQGPIKIVPGPREYGAVPDISIKYYNAPDQVNATIGLYSINSSAANPEQWKNISRNVNGEFTVTTPGKVGTYHFRIYDNNDVLLAVSDEIKVVEADKENGENNTPTEDAGAQPNQGTEIGNIDSNALNAKDLDLGYYRDKVNEVLNVKVTGKLGGSVWGNGIYTDDSDISTAAVHAGVVKYGETKTVKITILPGQDNYGGSWRNGVKSSDYIEFDGSFKFTDITLPLKEQSLTEGIGMTTHEEDIYLVEYQGKHGTVINLIVTGDKDGDVWGTDIYSDDSDISTAAVHAGILKVGETKTISITLLPGQVSYKGSVRNGIESSDYGEWDGSFKFNENGPTQPTTSQTNTSPKQQYENSEVFDEGIVLSWQNKNDLGYRLFRSTSEDELGISVTDFYITSNSYADVNVEPNTTYYYTVKPVLKEADPLNGKDEILGDIIKRYTVTTGGNIINQASSKKFIILQIDNPNMSVNGKLQEIDPGRGTTPMIISSRSMVPIRAVVEAINGTVGWDNSSQKITLTANGNTVIMWINKNEIVVNGKAHKIDVAPTIVNGRTYVPVRFAAENLNTKVYWINTTREAVIIE